MRAGHSSAAFTSTTTAISPRTDQTRSLIDSTTCSKIVLYMCCTPSKAKLENVVAPTGFEPVLPP